MYVICNHGFERDAGPVLYVCDAHPVITHVMRIRGSCTKVKFNLPSVSCTDVGSPGCGAASHQRQWDRYVK